MLKEFETLYETNIIENKKWVLIMNKCFAFALFSLLSITLVTPLSGETLSPEPAIGVIETLNATLLDSMKRGDKLGYSGRYALLDPVMNQSFSFPFMVRKSCGSYWKTLDSNQQTELLNKYITWSVGTYAERFKEYKGQQFVVIASERIREKYIRVTSHIEKNDKKTRVFKYLLLKDKENWRIVDIQVEGVSQLSLTRSQFKSVLKDRGIDGLLENLNEKIRILNQDNPS